jgi:hypothetical protein
MLASHRALPLLTVHARPQPPQLVTSLPVSTQLIPQRVWPPTQPLEHMPARVSQMGVESEHALPHIPQLLMVLSGVSQPLAAIPSQSPKPALHMAITHAPAEQPAVALASVHALPHIPQLAALVRVSTSQPLALLRSQLPKPIWQSASHVPLSQMATALAPAGQRFPQLPQLSGSTAGLTHDAPHASNPSGHDPSLTVTSRGTTTSSRIPTPESSAPPLSCSTLASIPDRPSLREASGRVGSVAIAQRARLEAMMHPPNRVETLGDRLRIGAVYRNGAQVSMKLLSCLLRDG